jgi:Zn-dependent peptidase ImmA (M78 family)
VENRPTFLDPQNRQETEANEFASELLMPEPFLRRDVADAGLDVPALAKRYQVSEQAMWIQLIDHKIVGERP